MTQIAVGTTYSIARSVVSGVAQATYTLDALDRDGVAERTMRHLYQSRSPLGEVSGSAVAVLTDEARTFLPRIMSEGLRLGGYTFQVGRGGYDPTDPATTTMPDPSLNALEDPVFPGPASFEPVDRIERPSDTSAAFLCRLEVGECPYVIGEAGVFAEVTASPANPAEVGYSFLFCVAHFPIRARASDTEVTALRLVFTTGS